MRKMIVVIALSWSLPAYAEDCSKIFDASQLKVIQQAYSIGKPHGLGWSLAAIAWQESNAGKYRINVDDPSFGVFAIYIKSAMKRTGTPDGFKKNLLAQRLVDDLEFSASLAIEELQHWQEVHGDDWSLIWASYNAGNNFDSVSGRKYAKDIKLKIGTLKQCSVDFHLVP